MTPLRSLPGRQVAAAAVLVILGAGAGYLWAGHGRPANAPAAFSAALAAAPGGPPISSGISATTSSGPSTTTSSGPSTTSSTSEITVTGTGTVSGTPDTLELSMGVSVTKPSVTDALDGADAAASAVQASLRQHGVADADLQTSGLSIQPQYSAGNSPVISGYQVSESLTAALHDLKNAGSAISAAAQAGGNATRIDAVGLDLSDTGTLVSAARRDAFNQARDEAQQYAQAAGVQLGAVRTISEGVSEVPPVLPGATAAAAGAGSVPIAAGSQDLSVSVTVTFGIAD